MRGGITVAKSPISDKVLATIRDIDASMMPSTCQQLRRKRLANTGGGSRLSDYLVISAFPCRVDRSGGIQPQENVQGGRAGVSVNGAMLFVPLDIEVEPDDRIEATTAIYGIPMTDLFEVQGKPGAGSYSSSLAVPCEQIN